jgi:type IV pilus assembly protein PilM
MAKSNAVWGIDIGQCALKALRCRPHDKEEKRMVIEAFDYIEYPKILTQPEANREELIREALAQFVSRNDVSGDSVAIAVPGQSGLARFIKLPPVERKKIPDIVKYEARQQIPFALEDVVWDYQPLIGSEDEGYALETEVGIFAMKRDQVARHLRPMEEAHIPVDIIQLAPLAIYNFICFDRLAVEGAYDPANPPVSTVIISLGTDTTDLVITNGFRVWQRSIPIGGNHFTKSLTKELKLTFAKAEHLKRNAMKAENPKAVFQAMRPVFSDLVAEIQRSIGFFTSNNRNAKLGDIVALGNPMKLPGLQRYLSQNLDQEVKLIDEFDHLVGGTATASPQFKENQLTFGVAYGLCVQALGAGQLRTNLLPEEIVTVRLVKAKKPWAVAAVALLLVGMTVNYFGHYSSWKTADVEDPAMKAARDQATTVANLATSKETTHKGLIDQFDTVTKIGENLRSNVDGRLLWLEVLKAVNAALPKDTRPPEERKETPEDIAQRPELHIQSIDCEHFPDLATWYALIQPAYQRARDGRATQIVVPPTAPAAGEAAPGGETAATGTATETPAGADAGAATTADAGTVPPAPTDGTAPGAEGDGPVATDSATAPPADATAAPADVTAPTTDVAVDPTATDSAFAEDTGTATDVPAEGGDSAAGGLTGEGWVFEIRGYHLHNSLPDGKLNLRGDEGWTFVWKTFIKQLEEGTVKLPDGPDGELVDVKIADLGIKYPVQLTSYSIKEVQYSPEAVDDPQQMGGAMPMAQSYGYGVRGEDGGYGGATTATEFKEPEIWKLRVYDFLIQFAWQPTPRSKRLDNMAKKESGGEEEVPSTAAVPDDTAGDST